jgi:hypothetical protein
MRERRPMELVFVARPMAHAFVARERRQRFLHAVVGKWEGEGGVGMREERVAG